jgi:hypothetical protein
MTTPRASVRSWSRRLLRLYPRSWRQRYGEEFTALVESSPLTPQVVLDVVAGATVERVRALIELRSSEIDPLSVGRIRNSMTLRDNAVDFILLATLVTSTMALGRALGWPWPPVLSWTSWITYFCWISSLQARYGTFGRPLAPRAERIGLAYYYFIEAAAFMLPIFLLGRTFRMFGVPDPPERLFLLWFALGGAWVVRLVYCGFRIGLTPTTWNGMRNWEIRVWKLGAVAFCVTVAVADRDWKFFWVFAMVSVYLLKTPTGLLQLGAARRRASLELTAQRLREKFIVQSFPANWR